MRLQLERKISWRGRISKRHVLMISLDCLVDLFQSPEFLAKARVCYQIVRSALDSLISRSAVIKDSPSTSAVAAIMRSAGSLG